MNSFLYIPRTGEEVVSAAPRGTKLFLYSDLCKYSIDDLFKILGKNNMILYQDPSNMSSGHWVSLSFNPKLREAYFFSSYGGKPDEEKNKWLSYSELLRSGQTRNVINDLLKVLFQNGWKIYYNDYQYQISGDRTASCGIWSAAFLNSRTNPDIFEYTHESPQYYFEKYF